MGWVRLHPYNIAQKVQIVVEHYRENGRAAARRQGQGDGGGGQPRRGRALADWPSESTSSERGYQIGTLVAFSGEVNDPESGARTPFTETARR